MKWIVITMPDFIENEANYINQLFEAGLDLLHLRKPESCIADCERLLQEINPKWYPGIVVHDHFSLCGKYHLHGIHLNRRNHQVPDGFRKSVPLLPQFRGGNRGTERSCFQLRFSQSYLR